MSFATPGLPTWANTATVATCAQTGEQARPAQPPTTVATSTDLLVELAYRLKSLRNAAVLTHLLRVGADETVVKTTPAAMARHELDDQLSYKEVRNAIEDLVRLGLVTTVVHPNTRTHLTVDRAAVLALLAQPLSGRLPGLAHRDFAFLTAWRDLRAQAHTLSTTSPASGETDSLGRPNQESA